MSCAPGPRAAAASPRDGWGSLSPGMPVAAAGAADQPGAMWLPPASRSSSRSRGNSDSSWGSGCLAPLLAGPRAMVGRWQRRTAAQEEERGRSGGGRPTPRRESTRDSRGWSGRLAGRWALGPKIHAGRSAGSAVPPRPSCPRPGITAVRSPAEPNLAEQEPARCLGGRARTKFAAHGAPGSAGPRGRGGAGRGGPWCPWGWGLVCPAAHPEITGGPVDRRLWPGRPVCVCVCACLCAHAQGWEARE